MYSPDKVINGTFGELWINDHYLAEVTALEAKATIEKTEVNQVGSLTKGYKMTGLDCKGTIKINKVSSFFLKLLSERALSGNIRTYTIISKLADPSANGVERVRITGVTFDEIVVANWETKKLGEESIPFTFTGWELLDPIHSI